jgi:hypothetical protein
VKNNFIYKIIFRGLRLFYQKQYLCLIYSGDAALIDL